MLERGLYCIPTNSYPKLNLGEQKLQRNQNTRRGVREYKTEQKEPGASVKAFQTGVNFQRLHFKTNFCFQLYTFQQPIPSSLWGLCLLGIQRENQDGWDLAITNSTTLCHVKAERLSCGQGYGQRKTRLV